MIKPFNPTSNTDYTEDRLIFHLERTLFLVENNYLALAWERFHTFRDRFRLLLPPEQFTYLEDRVQQPSAWTDEEQQKVLQRLKDAFDFGEHQTAHDCAHELLLRHPEKDRSNSPLYAEVSNLLATNNPFYIEPDEIALNTFFNAEIQFQVENGNPGFKLTDSLGNIYRCFIKDTGNVQVGDCLKLKITNIPGFEITSKKNKETILYLEPRVEEGDIIEVELSSLSHTGNSFTFRYRSYDGFLWFKKRGVNKKLFNPNTLQPKDRILAKILYTTEEVKRSNSGNTTRLGLIKAIPIKQLEKKTIPHMEPREELYSAYN